MRIWLAAITLSLSTVACSPSLPGRSAEGNASSGDEQAPTGAAGFDFAAAPTGVRQACEGAGKTWTSVNNVSGTCSGPATSVGFDATVRVDFCNKKSCVITLEYRPKSNWLAAYNDVKQKLAKELGTPTAMPTKGIPEHCGQEEKFEQCLEAGELRQEFRWQWPTRQQVTFTVGKPENGAGPAAIRVQYVTPP